MALVVAHYKREHYINFYASRLSVTTTYLSRIIRRQTGKTAAYFLGGMLYAEACRLLTRTDYTAQQIAEVLNFSDQSAFGKFEGWCFSSYISSERSKQLRAAHK